MSFLYYYFTNPYFVGETDAYAIIATYVTGTNVGFYLGPGNNITTMTYVGVYPTPFPTYTTDVGQWTIGLEANFGILTSLPGLTSYYTTITNEFANSFLTQVLTNGYTMGLTTLNWAFYNCNNLSDVPTNFGTSPDNITEMISTFQGASSFNQNINTWNFSNVTTMQSMFQNASVFNNGSGSLNWNVSNVVNFSNMFYDAYDFNNGAAPGVSNALSLSLSTNPINMQGMFVNAFNFNCNISGWNTSTVTNMQDMFVNAFNFTSDLSSWNVSACTSMVNMFSNASSFSSNLSTWNVSQTDMQNMFTDTRNSDDVPSTIVQNLVSYNSMTISDYDATLQGWSTQTWTSPTAFFTTNCLIYSNQDARNILIANSMQIAGDVYIPPDTDIYNTFTLTYNYQNNGTTGTGGTFTNIIPSVTGYSAWTLYIGGVQYGGTGTISSDRKSVTFTITNGLPLSIFPLNIVITCPGNQDGPNGTIPYYFLGRLQAEVVCFNEGTKILYMNKQMVDQYIRIELLKPGDFVKTFKHGYRKIDMIGKNVFINTPTIFKKCMYKMEKTDMNGLIADLIVTGGHSILVDEISDEERVLNEQLFWGPTPKLDNKYLLLAAVSNQFKPIKNNIKYTYYHLVLDNEDVNEERYGIWANGILTETPSKEFFKKQRFMLL